MGDCRYCGKPAGVFRHAHRTCEQAHSSGAAAIVDRVLGSLRSGQAVDSAQQEISLIRACSFISDADSRGLVASGWSKGVLEVLESGLLSEDQERCLLAWARLYGLTKDDLDANGAFTRVVKAAVIRDLTNGLLPQRCVIEGDLSIVLKKGEQVIWLFNNSPYLEDRTRRRYVGKSQGVSIRLAKGLYYRVGASAGEAVDTVERVQVDTGSVVLTDKHVYFAGQQKSLRIPFQKIISMVRFSDGIGVMRDGPNAKLQVFVTGDGWFTHNVLANLVHRSD